MTRHSHRNPTGAEIPTPLSPVSDARAHTHHALHRASPPEIRNAVALSHTAGSYQGPSERRPSSSSRPVLREESSDTSVIRFDRRLRRRVVASSRRTSSGVNGGAGGVGEPSPPLLVSPPLPSLRVASGEPPPESLPPSPDPAEAPLPLGTLTSW